jgi:hypothetical protein
LGYSPPPAASPRSPSGRSDGIMLDENRKYSSYLDTFNGKDLIKIIL